MLNYQRVIVSNWWFNGDQPIKDEEVEPTSPAFLRVTWGDWLSAGVKLHKLEYNPYNYG